MATLIERQIEDWEKRGVVDAETATRLRDDIGAGMARVRGSHATRSARRFSFFQVVAFFAAISIAAAVLIFVAANWEYVPRLVRVSGVMAIVAFGYLGGAFVRQRFGLRRMLVEEAFYLVGGAAFIGGVALVGQMYHISGDTRDAALLYAAGLGLSGFAVRSRALVAVAAGWITYWHLEGPQAGNLLSLQFLVFAVSIGAGIAFAMLTKARWLRRVLYLAGLVGLVPFAWEVLKFVADLYDSIPPEIRIAVWVAIYVLSLVAILAGRFLPEVANRIPPLSTKRAGGQFAVGLLSIAFLHGELDTDAGLIVVSCLAVIFVLAALYAYGRDRRVIRYISYVVFVGEVFIVYGETVYSMLGTSGFFLALGLVLAVIAFVVYRLERLWKARKSKEATNA
ncbi:DUF2157 domain-containing protein [Oricola indica]|uniref:DUF2157 domain-containing protein n=1 Tax=Oricola indica TaxID=2872591 RepID=UPI003CCB76B9